MEHHKYIFPNFHGGIFHIRQSIYNIIVYELVWGASVDLVYERAYVHYPLTNNEI